MSKRGESLAKARLAIVLIRLIRHTLAANDCLQFFNSLRQISWRCAKFEVPFGENLRLISKIILVGRKLIKVYTHRGAYASDSASAAGECNSPLA